jgi:hypothetical protein
MEVYRQSVDLLLFVTGGAIVWLIFGFVRGWHKSGQTLERLRREAKDKPTSWQGSAEQSQLHSADQIRDWSNDSPHY